LWADLIALNANFHIRWTWIKGHNGHRDQSLPPFPPFNEESAIQKVRAAEDAWNTRDPARVALAYTLDSRWRNRAEFPCGRAQIEAFLTRKWARELDYRLIKELWTFAGNRIAVRFAYPAERSPGKSAESCESMPILQR
jgi:hypothetical protein